MSTLRTLAKNSAASLVIQITAPLASFVIVFVIARTIGNIALGQISTALSTYYIFEAVAAFGLNALIIRDVSQARERGGAYLVNASILTGATAVVTTLIMWHTAAFCSDDDRVVTCIRMLSLSLLFSGPTMVMQSICAAYERFEHIMLPTFAANACKAIVGVVVLVWTQDIVDFTYVILLSQAVNFAGSFHFACRYLNRSTLHVDRRLLVYMVRNAPVFALIMGVSTFRNNIDVVLLNKWVGSEGTGYYSAAIKLVNLLKIGIGCYIQALAPVIYREFTDSRDRWERICFQSIRYLLIIVIPVAVGTAILSENIISLIFGKSFLPSSPALSILIWVTVFYSLNQVFANILIGSNHQVNNLYSNLGGLITGLALYALLIPHLSYLGCAIATTLAVMTTALLQYLFVLRARITIHFLKSLVKPMAAVSGMSCVTLALHDQNVFGVIGASAALYTLLLFLLKTFHENDLRIMKSLLAKRNSGAL
jgi:O-antigen/teichoic acid export membrane protein